MGLAYSAKGGGTTTPLPPCATARFLDEVIKIVTTNFLLEQSEEFGFEHADFPVVRSRRSGERHDTGYYLGPGFPY